MRCKSVPVLYPFKTETDNIKLNTKISKEDVKRYKTRRLEDCLILKRNTKKHLFCSPSSPPPSSNPNHEIVPIGEGFGFVLFLTDLE